jgi:small subunit ribosomal protein S8e
VHELMVIIHKGNIGRTPTGGRYKQSRGKRKFEIGRKPSHTTTGKRRLFLIREKGGGQKTRLVLTPTANVFNAKTKTYTQSPIKTVKENPANRHFVRQNIMTKGAIIETELGLAKVTSRPGKDGTVNAILV